MSLIDAYKQCIVNTCIRLHKQKNNESTITFSTYKNDEKFVSQIPFMLKKGIFEPINSDMDKAKKELLKEHSR